MILYEIFGTLHETCTAFLENIAGTITFGTMFHFDNIYILISKYTFEDVHNASKRIKFIYDLKINYTSTRYMNRLSNFAQRLIKTCKTLYKYFHQIL